MKSEIDALWETPPEEREQRYRSMEIAVKHPKLKEEFLLLLEKVLKRFPDKPRPKEWVVNRMIENLINHVTKYRTFAHSENYVTDVVLRDYGCQVRLVSKTTMASWNRGRRFMYRMGKMPD